MFDPLSPINIINFSVLLILVFLCILYKYRSKRNKYLVNEIKDKIILLTKAGNLVAWSLDFKTGKREMIQGKQILPDTLSDNDYSKYFHPDDAILISQLIKSIKNGKRDEVKDVVIRFIKNAAKEEYIYFEVFMTTEKGEGKNKKLFCVNRDITSQVLYQQKIDENKIRNKIIFQEGQLTQYDYDVVADKFIIYYSNKLFSDHNKISMDDYTSLFHPEDLKKCAEIIEKMKQGVDFSFSTDYRIKSIGDSEWQSMLLTNTPLKKDSNGKVLLYTGIRQDNTKWKQLSTDLERKNLLLNTVIDRMPCMFFMKDVDKDYSYCLVNDNFCKNMGKTEDEILNHTDYQLFDSKAEADHFREDDVEAVKQGIKSVQEVTMWCGKRTVWHTTKLLFYDSTGERYMIGMSIDITQLDDTFAELKQAKEKAERSDRLKSSFLANMSHEIRTPLNAIVGFTDLIISSNDPVEKDKYGKIVTNNSELLLKLINDILDISKIEAGYLELKTNTFDIVKTFSEYENIFRSSISNEVKFLCINPHKSCYIESDKNRLHQVVNNFMSNAIKYTPSGTIKLGYECVEKGIRIFVEDTGIGISEKNKNRVFQRFEKFDSFAQGTGLGLSICKAVAISIGGEIGFKSQEGKGSTFWIMIPCSPVIDKYFITENKPKTVIQAGKKETSSCKFLVVEDNDSNFVLLKTILKDYQVFRAFNGLEALKMAQKNQFSIIFMDIKMPIMDGLEATRKIREFDLKTPIIAVTANAFDSDRDQAILAGCNNYISKPIQKDDVLNLINQYVSFV